MDIEGKVVLDLGMQTGVSRAGNNWKKREFVIETFGQYPRKVKITLFGDRADTVKAEIGLSYVFGVDVESREYNGRWYTDVTAFSSRELGENKVDPNPVFNPAPASPVSPSPVAPMDPFATSGDSSDDLPF